MAQREGDWTKQWGQLVAQAWADEAFKRRLLADPAAVLKEQGLEAPPGVRVRVLEDTDQVLHLTLPQQPTSEISHEDLERVAAGQARFGQQSLE
jgi:hypothetical protein